MYVLPNFTADRLHGSIEYEEHTLGGLLCLLITFEDLGLEYTVKAPTSKQGEIGHNIVFLLNFGYQLLPYSSFKLKVYT